MAPHVRLTYFPFAARGLAARIAFRAAAAAGAITFEDVRLSFLEWGALKPSTPLGKLPLLDVDGVTFVESVPIAVYAASLAGLFPADPTAALRQNEVIAIIDELMGALANTSAADPASRIAYATEVAPRFLAALAQRADAGPFFCGAQEPQAADLYWLQYFTFYATSGRFDHVPTDFVDKCEPALAALATRVKASPLYAAHGNGE